MKYGSCRAALAIASAIIITSVGCQPPPPPPPPPPGPPAFVVPANRSQAAADLVTRTTQFNLDITAFPGKSAEEHRQNLATVLDNLSKILRLANGPVESPEFANRIAVIRAAEATAKITDLPRTRMEAVENEALQAAAGAFNEITTRYLFDDTQLPGMLNKLATQVDAAKRSIGPMHDLDATGAFTALQAVVQQTTNDMTERFGSSASYEAPAPALPPAAAPASAPSTLPTSMPATMP